MAILKTEVRAVAELSPELADSIRTVTDREFGSDPMVYASPEWYALGFLEGSLTARAGILQRTITIGTTRLQIGGISFVVTEPDNRHRGFARAIMTEAVSFIKDQLHLPFGLLTCKPRLEALYVKMGWRTVVGPTVFAQAEGVRSCGGLTMIVECGGMTWPEGKIDLCGLPW